MTDELLDRKRIVELFDELSRELRFQGARAQIYVIGGAAMSLAFDRERATRDVDARIDAGHYRLTQAVQAVGRRHGLADSWLNEQATTAIPRTPDGRAQTVYESAYLTVTGASARHLLAMKLAAGRGKDQGDIALLCKHLGLKGPDEAIRVYRELFPGELVKASVRRAAEAAFPERSVERGR